MLEGGAAATSAVEALLKDGRDHDVISFGSGEKGQFFLEPMPVQFTQSNFGLSKPVDFSASFLNHFF